MKNRTINYYVGWVLVLLVSSCVDPYNPKEVASSASYLVVNGFFNSDPGTTTTIQLSRSQNLNDTKSPTPETKATVTIESANKEVFTLTEGVSGSYSLSGVTPVSGETYRLHIKTSAGNNYYSDYVPVITTPPIDSISWYPEDNNLQINVNTHDPNNNTYYYRWEYDETWEYTAAYYSSYIYNEDTKKVESRQEDVFRCWGSATSKDIKVTSTKRLSRDIVSQFPLNTIEGTSIKLYTKYSILVRQFALSEAGYTYYDQLARITQNIGSLFDPQPSQITGNIYSETDPSDLVLGFFRVGNVTTKRIFIRKSELPSWTTLTGYGSCTIDTMSVAEIQEALPAVITDFERFQYLTTTFECVDCRLKGGVTTKPDFWEN